MTVRGVASRILPRRGELRAMVRLAVPVVTVQVGMMLMGVVDTVMVGHLGPEASPGGSTLGLAAVALGHLYFFGIGVFGMGTLLVLDPVWPRRSGRATRPAWPVASSAACCSRSSSPCRSRVSCGSPVRSSRPPASPRT